MLIHKLHPFNFIILPLIGLIATFICHYWQEYLFILLIMLIDLTLLVNLRLNYKALLWFSLTIIPFLIAMFISSYFFTEPSAIANLSANSNNNSINNQLLHSINLVIRLYTLAIISFGFMYHMPKELVLTNLMQRKLIQVKIGFSLLAVFNAAHYLGNEFKRIQIAYQMRYQRIYFSPSLILPLLIASARYAHNLSISMYSRGLNQERSYLTELIHFSYLDWALILVNCAILGYLILYQM